MNAVYRHVWLTTKPALHLATDGVKITTPNIKRVNATHASAATVSVAVVVRNVGAGTAHGTVTVVVNGQTSTSAVSVTPNATASVNVNVSLTGVNLWSPDQPHLYNAAVSVTAAGGTGAMLMWRAMSVPDMEVITFGFRTLVFDAAAGFELNGVPTKLYGGCVHHDNGPLGSAAIDRAEERRVELLKAQGYNAIRTSHNPVSPAFLAACDRLGMMVMCEAFDTWPQGKNPDDYHVATSQAICHCL